MRRPRAAWPLAAACALGLPGTAGAADPAFDPVDDLAVFDKPPAGQGPWRGDLAAGLQANTGNTQSGSLTSRAALGYVAAGRDNRLDLSYIDAWARGSPTDHKFSAGDQLKIDIARHSYGFAQARYAQDEAAAVTTRLSLAAGIGRHLLRGRQQVDVDLGAGWSHSQDHDADDFEDRAIAVLGLLYRGTLGASSEVRQTLQSELSGQNMFLGSVTSLRLKLVGKAFVSMDYELRHNRHAPAGTEHTDQIHSVNLGWTFGSKPAAVAGEPLLATPPEDEYLRR